VYITLLKLSVIVAGSTLPTYYLIIFKSYFISYSDICLAELSNTFLII